MKWGTVVESSVFEPWESADTNGSNQMFLSDLYNLTMLFFFFFFSRKECIGNRSSHFPHDTWLENKTMPATPDYMGNAGCSLCCVVIFKLAGKSLGCFVGERWHLVKPQCIFFQCGDILVGTGCVPGQWFWGRIILCKSSVAKTCWRGEWRMWVVRRAERLVSW